MDTIANNLYTTTVTSTGGRDGSLSSEDGVLQLDVASPPELGGPGGATNPEQLFAAGYAACFHSALTLVASRQGVDTDDSAVRSTVRLGMDEGTSYVMAVDIVVDLPGVDPETRSALVEKAHQLCPYSRATKDNIEVNVTAA